MVQHNVFSYRYTIIAHHLYITYLCTSLNKFTGCNIIYLKLHIFDKKVLMILLVYYEYLYLYSFPRREKIKT